jgi:hypothetical protein
MVGFNLQRAREIDHAVQLIKGGTIVGNNLANTTSWPATDAYVSYGGSSNLWGSTWALSDINANNFGVAIAARIQNGTARIDHVRVSVTYFSTLPVELLAFKAEPEGGTVRLDWATATEQNNHHFTVQRSANTVDWEDVVHVPGAGNSLSLREYTARDERPLVGTSYYRLVQHDVDGTQDLSDMRVVIFGASPPEVYPNPTADGALTFWDPEARRLAVAVYDNSMRLVRQTAVNNGEPAAMLNNLPDGSYFLLVNNGQELHTTRVMRVSSAR